MNVKPAIIEGHRAGAKTKAWPNLLLKRLVVSQLPPLGRGAAAANAVVQGSLERELEQGGSAGL